MVLRQDSAGQATDRSLLPFLLSPGLDAESGSSLVRSSGQNLELELERYSVQNSSLSQSIDPEALAIWRTQVEEISDRERINFLKYQAGDLRQYLAEIEHICEQHGEKSRALKVARLIKPLFEMMKMYGPIAETMTQADPMPSALVLGGITCILSISSRFLDYQEKIAQMLSDMGENLEVLLQYGQFVYQNDSQVQKALLAVYGDILLFCRDVSRLFLDENGNERSSTKTFLASLAKSFESKFGNIITKFNKDLEAFERRAMLCDRIRMEHDRNLSLQFMRYQVLNTNRNIQATISVGQSMLATMDLRYIEAAESRKSNNDKNKEKKRQRVIAWIPSISFQIDQKDIYSKRLDGTGQWLLDNGTFQRWEKDPKSELLWIFGKHGCGKSYLASRVIQSLDEARERDTRDPRDSRNTTALAYIYCNSLDSTKIDPPKLLGSILKQLCHLLPMPEIEPTLERHFDRQYETDRKGEGVTGKQIEEAILAILARFAKTFIVVDGLDECHKLQEGGFRGLCRFVRSLTQTVADTSVVKVLVFSRPEYTDIKNAFDGCPRIQVDAGRNEEDIRLFITEKVSGEDLHVRKHKELQEEVEKDLLSGADGMFLWVDLLVKTLKGQRTAKEIRAKLKSLPQDLDEVYELSMKRILKQDESVRARALRILLWTTNAKRALSQGELIEALAIEPGTKELDQQSKLIDDEGFTSECGDLVVLRDGYYHLLHSSLKDYLKKLSQSESNFLREYQVMQNEADGIIGSICLTYLQFDKFQNGPVDTLEELEDLRKENPFIEYASIYWGQHLAKAKETELQELTKSFLLSNGPRELSMQLLMLKRGEPVCPYPGKSTPLHMLAIFDLVQVTNLIPNLYLLKNERDGFGSLPLDYALTEESKSMSILLLETAEDAGAAPKPLLCHYAPMHAAASNNWGDVIERLILCGYDKESKAGEIQQAPLHVAAGQGCESALVALLKSKVNVNSADVDGTTPLIYAAESNNLELAKLLIEAGADVNVQGWNGTTALHYAAKNGNTALAKELLLAGAKVDTKCYEGWGFRTPLHLACEEDSHEVVKLLINKGADIEKAVPGKFNALLFACSNGALVSLKHLLKSGARIEARNDVQETAFHLAAFNGHLEILKALFEKRPGPDLINSVDVDRDTPLHDAVSRGHGAEARFLLENGALVNKPNKKSESALHLAIKEGDIELCEILLHQYKADAKMQGLAGFLPLHYAAYYGHSNLIPLLLKAGVDPEASNDGIRAVYFAAKQNKLDFIRQLLEAVPTLELAPRSDSGFTPLHIAASNGFSELVGFFLQHKDSSLQVKNADSNLPLHLAAWNGHIDVVKQLMTPENVNASGFFGRTALFGASSRGHIKVVDYLLDNNANSGALDEDGRGPLLTALAQKHADVGALLLDRKADPKIPDKYGATALHEAASMGNYELVKRLLDEGCDGLCTTFWNDTPFLRAVSSGKVEVVDLFLARGFNGCGINCTSGKACLHVAAEIGSIEMLKKLVNAGEVATAIDSIGLDALCYAAATGHVEMIDALRDLGIGPNGLGSGKNSPLTIAVAEGFYNFACKLIDSGADVNKITSPPESSPLSVATARRRPLIVEKLLKSGADPTHRDALAYGPLDYALRDPKIWAKIRHVRTDYKPVDLQSRMPTLRKTLRKCTEAILALPENLQPQDEYERGTHLEILGAALEEMNIDSDNEAAKVCYTELANPSVFSNYSYTWECNICKQTTQRMTWHLCTVCHSVSLCPRCYSDYIEGGGIPMSAPKGFRVVEKLENELKNIRALAEPAADIGGRFFNAVWGMLKLFHEWVDEKLKEYEDWQKTYNDNGRFDGYKRPGQKFLELIQKARQVEMEESQKSSRKKAKKAQLEEKHEKEENKDEKEKEKKGKNGKNGNQDDEKSDAEDAKDQPDPFSTITDELAKFYRDYKSDKEIAEFICCGHKYLEIPHKSQLTEPEKRPFDANTKVTREWLSELLEKYRDDQVDDPEGGQRKAKATQLNGRDKQSQIQEASKKEKSPEDDVAHVIGEPTAEREELADTVIEGNITQTTEVPASGGELGGNKSNDNHLDNAAPDNKEIAATPSVESSKKRRRLANVRKEIKKSMLEYLAIYGAVEQLYEASEKKEEHDDAKADENEKSERDDTDEMNQDSLANSKADDKEDSSKQGDQDDTPNQDKEVGTIDQDKHDGTKQEEHLKLENLDRLRDLVAVALAEEAIAWDLAQTILVGSVEDSIFADLSRSDDDEIDKNEKAAESKEEEKEESRTRVETVNEEVEKIRDMGEGKDSQAAEQKGNGTCEKADDDERGQKDCKEADEKGEAKDRTGSQVEKKDVNSTVKSIQKANEISATELVRGPNHNSTFSEDRFKAYPEATNENLPQSPLSRKGTDLFPEIDNLLPNPPSRSGTDLGSKIV